MQCHHIRPRRNSNKQGAFGLLASCASKTNQEAIQPAAHAKIVSLRCSGFSGAERFYTPRFLVKLMIDCPSLVGSEGATTVRAFDLARPVACYFCLSHLAGEEKLATSCCYNRPRVLTDKNQAVRRMRP